MPPRKKTTTIQSKSKSTTKRKTLSSIPSELVQEQPVVIEQVVGGQVPANPVQELEETPQARKNEKPVPPAKTVAARSIPQMKEQFDLNQVVATGVIRSVWGNNGDVFARLALSHRGQLVENEDKFTSHLTLRFADGMVGGAPISIQSGDILNVQGYLVHREYTESLRKFLDDANAINFLDRVPPADLAAWRTLALKRQNGVVNVLSMTLLDKHGTVLTHFGEPIHEKDQKTNRAHVEGIVARVWEYRQDQGVDLFARLAMYDQYTPVDTRQEGNFGRQRRMAHYATLRFPCGKTSTGIPVHLKPKTRVRVIGQLRDKAQVVTLRDELFRIGSPTVAEMTQRVIDAERLSEIKNQQESLHILTDAVVVYSAGRPR